jgi:hypothetical protein
LRMRSTGSSIRPSTPPYALFATTISTLLNAKLAIQLWQKPTWSSDHTPLSFWGRWNCILLTAAGGVGRGKPFGDTTIGSGPGVPRWRCGKDSCVNAVPSRQKIANKRHLLKHLFDGLFDRCWDALHKSQQSQSDLLTGVASSRSESRSLSTADTMRCGNQRRRRDLCTGAMRLTGLFPV